jgi:hypothetical protein
MYLGRSERALDDKSGTIKYLEVILKKGVRVSGSRRMLSNIETSDLGHLIVPPIMSEWQLHALNALVIGC